MENKENALTLVQNNVGTIEKLILANMPKGTTLEEARSVAVKELSNCEMLIQKNPSLLNCTPKSFLLAVKQCICDGLTLAPTAGLAYLLPQRVKVGQNGNQDVYEWTVTYDPTVNGRLSMAFQSGSVLDVKRPYFTFDSDEKLDTVTVEFLVPSYPEPRWEVITFGKMHFKKWMDASSRKNNGKPNPNYTSWNGGIDPEFASTKAIRHGLGKRGTNLNGKRIQITSQPVNVLSEAAIEKGKGDDEFINVEIVNDLPL